MSAFERKRLLRLPAKQKKIHCFFAPLQFCSLVINHDAKLLWRLQRLVLQRWNLLAEITRANRGTQSEKGTKHDGILCQSLNVMRRWGIKHTRARAHTHTHVKHHYRRARGCMTECYKFLHGIDAYQVVGNRFDRPKFQDKRAQLEMFGFFNFKISTDSELQRLLLFLFSTVNKETGVNVHSCCVALQTCWHVSW